MYLERSEYVFEEEKVREPPCSGVRKMRAPPLKSKFIFQQMFCLWYTKEPHWKMGNNKRIPVLIRIMVSEQFKKSF